MWKRGWSREVENTYFDMAAPSGWMARLVRILHSLAVWQLEDDSSSRNTGQKMGSQ